MRLNFNRNLQIGYGISILMLVIVGFISYRTVHQLLDSNHAVEHSNLIIQKLEKTISVMKDAETGQRGYLLTNRRQFLEPYNGAYQEANGLVNQVAVLTKDNPGQQRNMAAIHGILLQRMTILQSLIEMRQQDKAITANDLDAGKAAMDALRLAINKAENDEQVLLDHRIAQLNRYTLQTPLFIVLAILLGLLISVLSYIKVTRDIKEKDRLQAELFLKEQETAAFNEELTAANEEITASNEELTAINEELVEAQEEINTLNRSLEEKVAIRTKALQESEEESQALNEELTAINEELAAANEEYRATNEELERARDQMEKSEELFRAIAHNIPGSLIMVVGPDHNVLMLEGDLLDELHYKGEAHEGKHLAEVTSPERYAANRGLYERMLAGEQFRIGRKGDGDADYQVDFVPLRNESANVYAGLIIALDITDLKKAEERSAKLAAIVESSDDAIISKTLDGIITSWNHGAERMFGYKEAEMIGQSILKLIPEDRHDEEPEIIARIKNGQSVEHFETKRLTIDGKLMDLSLTISPIRDITGNITGVSKIARDISERKKDEIRKNDFIGMVSHELKTPLTSLTALIQVLNQRLKTHIDPFVPSALGKANVQVKKMTGMINGFLNIARLESGQIQIEKQQFNLEELISEVIDEATLTVSSHTFYFEPGASKIVDADREKIDSVISNLLSNAVKYSPKGKQVTIKCGITGSTVLVSVEDEGMGIKSDDLVKLFERYYRVNSNHTQHISGFGIGLYLSAEIIRRHDGKIWAESESGKGSTFFFTLPLG
ncbi:PAS domain S-box-containing protein [Mucilaginibacter lappiensis]|uniref:histidine kinase n=1 Tax=Mucilaginibacter lappiensis TaxID=354630 RepID=A0ABR6PHM8_9SPHI|nr:PAS domain S-box protein [Mucilaginibacter lappiensis]MBB6107716.1 PAS domain S-box-containing protein [Mucilaginibacter lappiensis]SIP99406.1 PAS domain S-box-containing protein [Mucilaginibacter lappiensis]